MISHHIYTAPAHRQSQLEAARRAELAEARQSH